MKTIRIYRLTNLSPSLFRRLKEAQMEAAGVERVRGDPQAGTSEPCPLAGASGSAPRTKGRFALHMPVGASRRSRLSHATSKPHANCAGNILRCA